jgi:hypothetical protein
METQKKFFDPASLRRALMVQYSGSITLCFALLVAVATFMVVLTIGLTFSNYSHIGNTRFDFLIASLASVIAFMFVLMNTISSVPKNFLAMDIMNEKKMADRYLQLLQAQNAVLIENVRIVTQSSGEIILIKTVKEFRKLMGEVARTNFAIHTHEPEDVGGVFLFNDFLTVLERIEEKCVDFGVVIYDPRHYLLGNYDVMTLEQLAVLGEVALLFKQARQIEGELLKQLSFRKDLQEELDELIFSRAGNVYKVYK